MSNNEAIVSKFLAHCHNLFGNGDVRITRIPEVIAEAIYGVLCIRGDDSFIASIVKDNLNWGEKYSRLTHEHIKSMFKLLERRVRV